MAAASRLQPWGWRQPATAGLTCSPDLFHAPRMGLPSRGHAGGRAQIAPYGTTPTAAAAEWVAEHIGGSARAI
jgi:hypothetical protein